LADQYSLDGRVSLQLSGHTHGGQIRLPGVGALILPYLGRKYDLGLYKVNHMLLYTNRGIGVISEPVRYNCPPEITQFILQSA
jgi:predicted MPP superfamily phosphohydrolase